MAQDNLVYFLLFFFSPAQQHSPGPAEPFGPCGPRHRRPALVKGKAAAPSSPWAVGLPPAPPPLPRNAVADLPPPRPPRFPFLLPVSLPLYETIILMAHSPPAASCPPVYRCHRAIKRAKDSPFCLQFQLCLQFSASSFQALSHRSTLAVVLHFAPHALHYMMLSHTCILQ
jgi:hypothetical protein